MGFIFRLIHDSQTLRVENDPTGWEDSGYILKRSNNGDGVFKNYNLDLVWVKDGAEFIRSAYQSDGIAALVELKVSIWDINNSVEVDLFDGKLNMTEYRVDTSRGRLEVALPAENEDAQTRFLSLRKKEVQISKDENYKGSALPTISKASIGMHSQKLSQSVEGTLAQDYKATFQSFTNVRASTRGDTTRRHKETFYQAVSMDSYEKNTLRKSFNLGQGMTDNFDAVANWMQFDFDSIVDIRFNTPFEVKFFVTADHSKGKSVCGNGNGDLLDYFSVQLIYEIRDKDNNVLIQEVVGENINKNYCATGGGEITVPILGYSAIVIKDQVQFNAGDKLYTYIKVEYNTLFKRRFAGRYNLTNEVEITNYAGILTKMNISGVTTAPTSEAQGIMVFECLQRVAQHYLGYANAFKSDYYGRTDLGYADDGAGALRVIMSGYNLRGLDLEARPFFQNWTNLFNSLRSIDDISFGFEKNATTGQTILRVEKREFFYDSTKIIDLPAVTGLTKKVYKDGFITTFTSGYTKWFGQKQQGSLEEFNTERQYFTGITQLDKEQKELSKLLAGAYAIESTRRLQAAQFDEDTEYDEQIFIIQVLRTTPGESTDWKAESNEDITSITGVVDPEGVYNIKLTPARNARRHGKSLAASFVKPNGLAPEGYLRFSQGGGNYVVVSRLSGEFQDVEEGGNINMNAFTPILINEEYEFEHPLSLDQMKLLLANQNGIIHFTDNNGNKFKGFIKEVAMSMVSPGKSKSTFKLIRAYG